MLEYVLNLRQGRRFLRNRDMDIQHEYREESSVLLNKILERYI